MGKTNIHWDLNEFRGLIRAKYGEELLTRIEIYLITLDWKVKRAQYHADKVDQYWKSLMDGLVRWVPISSNPYFLEAQYCSAFEMEAMIQALHSAGDVLAQIVNSSFRSSDLMREDTADLNKILEKIPTSSLQAGLQQLYDSPEYRYFNAFSNVTKHRHRVDVIYCMYTGHRRSEGTTGFQFNDFKYRNATYKALSFDDIRNKYRNAIIQKIRRVGIEMNNLLRQ